MSNTPTDSDTISLRRWISRLDEAIETFDIECECDVLIAVLRDMANATNEPPFADRLRRLAARAASAVTLSERDIASVIARDVRSYLMCQFGRSSRSRNSCTAAAGGTKTLRPPHWSTSK